MYNAERTIGVCGDTNMFHKEPGQIAEQLMKKDIQTKREKEKRIVTLMIRLYCRKNHGTQNGLCPECTTLSEYAHTRSDLCPFMESKTFCSNCHVHCYKPEMRNRIRQVMRFSGPRMIFYHPVMAIRHLLETKSEARRMTKCWYGMHGPTLYHRFSAPVFKCCPRRII